MLAPSVPRLKVETAFLHVSSAMSSLLKGLTSEIRRTPQRSHAPNAMIRKPLVLSHSLDTTNLDAVRVELLCDLPQLLTSRNQVSSDPQKTRPESTRLAGESRLAIHAIVGVDDCRRGTRDGGDLDGLLLVKLAIRAVIRGRHVGRKWR